MEKASKYIDSVDKEDVKLTIPNNNPFALKMRMHRYIKAYREQMAGKDDVDHNKYDMLSINTTKEGVEISNVLDRIEDLVIKDSDTGEEIWLKKKSID